MDNKKIGLFISALRKSKNMTQRDLGAKLFVSDKAVSKWERGLSMPDIGLLNKLAEYLEVNISEILNGEKISNMTKKSSDEIIRKSIPFFQKKYFKNKLAKICITILIIIFIGYFAILIIGETTYGTLKFQMFNGFYSIDLPSFSQIRNKAKVEKFLKYLKENDYEKIKEILKINPVRSVLNENTYMGMDNYVENLENLKKEGFKILKYNYKDSYFRNSGYIYKYEIIFELKKYEYKIEAYIQGYGDGIVVDGSTMSSNIGKIFQY